MTQLESHPTQKYTFGELNPVPKPLIGGVVSHASVEVAVEIKPPQTPKERALGRIEHLKNVAAGKEDKFSLYFVLGVADHDEMHAHFLGELNLPVGGIEELTQNRERSVVGYVDGLALYRRSNCYEDGLAYDVYYDASFEPET